MSRFELLFGLVEIAAGSACFFLSFLAPIARESLFVSLVLLVFGIATVFGGCLTIGDAVADSHAKGNPSC